MTILLFDGEEDAYWWILCLEKFFKEHETSKSLKVLKAVGALRGSAFTWWIWWCRVHPRYNWDTFTTALLWRFKPEWREILPISDEEEEPIEESSSFMKQSVDADFSNFFEEFDNSQNKTSLQESQILFSEESVFPTTTEVEPVLAKPNFTNFQKSSLTEKPSSFDHTTQLTSVFDSSSMFMANAPFKVNAFRDDANFSVPPKPPDSDSTMKSPHSLMSSVMLKEKKSPLAPLTSTKPTTSMVEPNFKDWGFISDFNLEIPPKSLDCDSKKIISSALLQIDTAPSICSIQRESFIFMKEDTKFSNHALNPPPQPPSKPPDRSVYTEIIDFESLIPFVGEPQNNDRGFHDDADFAIPPKPPDQIFAGFLYCGESKFQRKAWDSTKTARFESDN